MANEDRWPYMTPGSLTGLLTQPLTSWVGKKHQYPTQT